MTLSIMKGLFPLTDLQNGRNGYKYKVQISPKCSFGVALDDFQKFLH